MIRPRHLASFLAAAALAAAGLAQGAQNAESPAATLAASISAPPAFTPTTTRGPAPAPAPERAALDWPQRIQSRLEEIGARKRELRPGHEPQLAAQLASVLARDPQPGAIAIHVRELETGRVLFDQRGDHHLNPASNQKILTAHAATELLGADYRFETRVALQGDTLYLVGEGDPTLQLADLHALASRVTDRESLSEVRRLVIDESAFSERRFAPGVAGHQGESAYLAPTGALSLNFNTVEIHVAPGPTPGAPVSVDCFPPSAQVELRNHARTASRGAIRLDSHAEGDITVVEVHGGLRANARPQSFRRRIHAPGRFTGHAFVSVLEAQGIDATNWSFEFGRAPQSARVLARHRSAPLVEVLAAAMKYSNNFATEQVLRTLAWRASDSPGDWETGLALLERFGAALAHEADALEFFNGSGLSRRGRATPSALVDLVSLADDDGSASAELLSSYAGFGREGTLTHRLAWARGRVRAKTGTLAGVTALTGIAASKDGSRTLGFSILVNGRYAKESRATQDRAVAAMLAWLD